MEPDAAQRYRSRVLREMTANRENPFNSPPSSTGSHGSETLSSIFSDPDGESTRRLNEDIARVTAPRSFPINYEAAHRKWPDYFGMPKNRNQPIFADNNTDTRPLSAGSKENKPPAISVKFTDDSTQDTWMGSNRTRAEMQARADTDSDLSSILSKSPARALSSGKLGKNMRQPSPLAKVHTRAPSVPLAQSERRPSISDALDRLRRASLSPKGAQQEPRSEEHHSPLLSSAKSSLTAVPPSPTYTTSPGQDASHIRSFFMPDVSHLGDFVTGTLRFSGSLRNGVPVFVKHGKVHDQKERPSAVTHAEVDGVEVPEDEEKIFVSMDMIREEIISLQQHYDKVQEYAVGLQQQVERLEKQKRSQQSSDGPNVSSKPNAELLAQKDRLETEIATLHSRLEQASRKISITQIENDSLSQEKDRAVKKLQEACEDINKLTRKLSHKEKEIETNHKQLEFTEQLRQDNDTLRRDLVSLKHGRDALELQNSALQTENDKLRAEQHQVQEELESLRSDNNNTRRGHQSLINENKSLRTNNKDLMDENDELRDNLDGVQHELDVAREQVEMLQKEIQTLSQAKATLQEDNNSLVRHNEKYFTENKILRRENSGFERSVHDLHDDNAKLKEEIEFLRQQLDHCRPLPKTELSGRIDGDETEENMTSAFFIPDITMKTNESEPEDVQPTNNMPTLPELTSFTQELAISTGVSHQEQQDTTRKSNTVRSEKREIVSKSKTNGKSSQKVNAQSQKVAFALPDKSKRSSRNNSHAANQGSKRRNPSETKKPISSKSNPETQQDLYEDVDESTGFVSVDNTTQTHSMLLSVNLKDYKEDKTDDDRPSRSQDVTSQSQKSQRAASQTRSSHKRIATSQITSESINLNLTSKESCPTLSNDARRILDGLCQHKCQNCTVCSRIASHRGIFTTEDLAEGKKRVSIPRPVPVTDRDLSVEDPTMRPYQSPGHALALVIKGLEDESQHLQLELSRLQAQYNSSDKSLGRRQRLSMAEGIRGLLKQLEAKNDQIYSLYDVLEGQKAAGQAMTEEEVEMTVLNITGMTVRDVTSGSEQLTWDGIQE
ncbi:hypothetical protein S40293_02517 [Stachybotrys chartarum IBT 40293]|nr:hypothetical protein S40293_02517 [Stachybotrys chartarum IBT 40293]